MPWVNILLEIWNCILCSVILVQSELGFIWVFRWERTVAEWFMPNQHSPDQAAFFHPCVLPCYWQLDHCIKWDTEQLYLKFYQAKCIRSFAVVIAPISRHLSCYAELIKLIKTRNDPPIKRWHLIWFSWVLQWNSVL